jgi:hypothetical protein
MDEKTAETLALAAGLDKAWANHRADVLAALETQRSHRGKLPRTRNPADEPAPPWRLTGGEDKA